MTFRQTHLDVVAAYRNMQRFTIKIIMQFVHENGLEAMLELTFG